MPATPLDLAQHLRAGPGAKARALEFVGRVRLAYWGTDSGSESGCGLIPARPHRGSSKDSGRVWQILSRKCSSSQSHQAFFSLLAVVHLPGRSLPPLLDHGGFPLL